MQFGIDSRIRIAHVRQGDDHFVNHEAPARDTEGSCGDFDFKAEGVQHSMGQLDQLGGEAVGVACGDEVDDGADHRFARLNGWWVDVGRVEFVEEGCVPTSMSDTKRRAI